MATVEPVFGQDDSGATARWGKGWDRRRDRQREGSKPQNCRANQKFCIGWKASLRRYGGGGYFLFGFVGLCWMLGKGPLGPGAWLVHAISTFPGGGVGVAHVLGFSRGAPTRVLGSCMLTAGKEGGRNFFLKI